MTLATRHADFARRDIWRESDHWLDDFNDWPIDWPKPRDFFNRFSRDSDNWWKDWPSDWPRMDAIMPRFSTQLDRMDRNWRNDPFWMDLYPRWAEPIFKEGIDVNSQVINDERKFAVDVDCYQFRPEEIQVKTLDDTLMIEGRHEDVRDKDNFTKMYFIRKYQLPKDVNLNSIQSSIDSKGRLTVEAQKHPMALNSRERLIPIEGIGRSSPRYDSGTYRSQRGPNSPIHVQTENDNRSASSRSASRANDSPRTDGVYSSHSYSYHRSDSRNRMSPHDLTMRNESRNYSPRQNLTSGTYGNGINGTVQHEERSSSRAQSHRSESRNGYRVESPASTTNGILRNGNTDYGKSDSPNSTQREYRSIQILRKTY
ncbi:unnamed protein product [Caenorhabditis bovis]|uniref:SHSP domain-containing protein n=1 Tax=Caenorhabditis bovis TaxID=2654633 RepID=A0A8S1EKC5_9PELO|nr:unnamed protein product [Caenorhabditis bovis]